MCCGGAKWKREEVPDHKFDFVDTREFTDNGFVMRLKYLFLYGIVLKSFLVYVSDIFTAITMISTKDWSNQIYKKCQTQQGCVFVDFTTAKWIFFGCILFGFLLLAYESQKAKKIIASRDISFAFTNIMANNYYSLRSYDHFCFFDHIRDSTRLSDDFAFFVFFTFKSWKRLILSDGPRQTINAFTLYALYLAKKDLPCTSDQLASGVCRPSPWYDVPKYFSGNNFSTSALLISTIFTLVVFVISLAILIVAAICYIPLLFHIQGNLKEYCCHKVDKRISEIIKRRQKIRLVEAARLAKKEAMGDFSHLKNKKGEFIAKPLPQPTLPNVSIEDEPSEVSSVKTRTIPPSYTQDYQYYNSDNYPPPMPSYAPYPNPYHASAATLPNDDPYAHSVYGDYDNESTAHLAASAVPFTHQSASQHQYGVEDYPVVRTGDYESHNVYQAHAGHVLEASRRTPMPSGHPNGLAYDGNNDAPYQGYPDAQAGFLNQSQQYYPQQGRGAGGYGGGNSGYAV